MGCGGCNGKKIPLEVEIQFGHPVLRDDGCIVFPETAPVVEGYEVDPEDDTVVCPTGVPCATRLVGIMMDRDGTYKPHHVCMESGCPHKSQSVTFQVCQECPHRVTGA